jgi:hypothetical protein
MRITGTRTTGQRVVRPRPADQVDPADRAITTTSCHFGTATDVGLESFLAAPIVVRVALPGGQATVPAL